MKARLFILFVCSSCFCPLAWSATGAAETAKALRTDSRAPYVHRITLYTDSGEAINPKDELAPPYSPKGTCGKCHPYDTISRGWHFNAPDTTAPIGRPAQPWIFTDLKTGTQIPVSYRAWPGTYRPADLGITPWQFVQRFARQMPGGGIGEKYAESVKDSEARWYVSGKLEIDCMICHGADPTYDGNIRARQIENQNFKWSPLVSAGFGIVRGEAKNAPDDYDPTMPPNPDFPDKTGPQLVYQKNCFDADDRVFFNIKREPSPERCYFCHTNREIHDATGEDWQMDTDVHLAAGMSCADCHRHGVDHLMVRGYRDEARTTEQESRGSLSCKGCHLGAGMTNPIPGGRLGAPQPKHRGIPTGHFDKLSCAVCHSGPMPKERAISVQTSRAHGLGLADQHRSDSAPPLIVEPVFVRDASGCYSPQRMFWPSFWAVKKGDSVKPIANKEVAKIGNKVFGKKEIKPDAWKPLTGDEVKKMIQEFAQSKLDGDPVYVCGGKLNSLGPDGALVSEDSPAASPTSWPMAHDVRPAAQALGAGGCADCHSTNAPISFGEVVIPTMAEIGSPVVKKMYEFQGKDPKMIRFFNSTFIFRPYLKILGFAVSALLAAIMLLYGLAGLRRFCKLFARED